MAKEIVLRLRVENADDIEALNKELQKSGLAFEEAEKGASRYSGVIKKSNPIVEELDKKTGGLVTSILDVADATKKANISFKATRTALIATGIGAFVVALGLVVAYWDDIVDLVQKTNERLQEQLELTQQIQSTLSSEISVLEKQIGLYEAQGKSTEELQKQRIALIEKLRLQNLEEARLLEIQLIRLEQTATELSLWEQIRLAASQALGGAEGLGQEASGLAANRLAEIEKLREQINKAKGDATELELLLFNLNNPKGNGELPELPEATGVLDEGNVDNFFKGTLERLTQGYSDLVDLEKDLGETQIATAKYVEDAKTRAAEEGSKKRAKWAEIENQQKLMLTQDTLGKMAALFGENTKAGKIAGSAQALINTYLGVTQVLSNKTTLPEPFGTINKIASIATVLASGLKAVQQINSVQTPGLGSSGSGVSASSGGGIAVAQPQFNVIGNTGINQLNETVANQTKDPVRSYVVYGDVKKAAELENSAIKEATL